jgi:putative membrane protein
MIGWRYWHNNPAAVAALILLGWLYALCVGPWRGHLAPGQTFPRAAAIRFYAGLLLGYLAVGSPLAWVGEVYLFSAHLVQHLVILYPVSGLLMLGFPDWLIDAWCDRPVLRRPLRVLTRPLTAGFLFVVVLSVWHLPKLYERALENETVRLVQYGSLIFIGILFWWPLLSPSRVLPPVRYGARLLYLFAIEVSLTAVFTYVLMADHAMYPTYAYAPRIIAGLSPLNDQLLAGVLLSGISSLVLVGALGVNFFRWAKQDRTASTATN